MKPGQASRTATFVCAGRALADATRPVARFEDPTALALLSDEDRERVTRVRDGQKPRNLREGLYREYVRFHSIMMSLRTVEIDDAIRGADHDQVVILGAGLDGRAWRMKELAGATVFEVDHPDTQRDKRSRVGGLTQAAREVRFVPVDFTRDSLDDALAAAGHDPARPTTWVWEGVVMYLSPEEVDATLASIARRSAPGSRVALMYFAPARIVRVIGWFVRRLGEPLRSTFTIEQMRALLAKHDLRVTRDVNIPEIAADVAPHLAKSAQRIRHMRIATAERPT